MDVFYSVLLLLAGTGVFLVGIVFFSGTLTRNASGRMRLLFKRLTKNRASGLGLGVGITFVSQSSTVTTVMVVGLVNAGLLTLFQATSVIIGANAGASLTMLILSLSALKIKYFFMATAFIGAFVKLFTKKENIVFIADLFVSFGVMFVGLALMSDAFSSNSPGGAELSGAFERLFQSVDFPLLLVLFGFLFTLITNSTNATTAIILSMMVANVLSFKSGAFLVIGANLATPSTAILASLTANTNAKRAAVIHLMFNLFGAIFFTAMLWSTQSWFVPWYTSVIPPLWQISIFHVMFNITTSFVLIWLVKPLNKLATKLIREAPNDQELLRTSFIGPELQKDFKDEIELITNEIRGMTERTRNGLNLAHDDLVNRTSENKHKIAQEKVWVDYLHTQIIERLVQLSTEKRLTSEKKQKISEYYRLVVDIKRMAGHSIFMANNTAKMKEEGLRFPPEIVAELNNLYEKIGKMFDYYFEGKTEAAEETGAELKKYCDNFSKTYLNTLGEGKFSVELGNYYYATMISFTNIANYLRIMA